MQLDSIKRYTNAVKVKPVRNRSVMVAESINDSVIIEIRKIVEDKDEIGISPLVFKVLKNKIHLSGLKLSRHAALALYACLADYFIRIDKQDNPIKEQQSHHP